MNLCRLLNQEIFLDASNFSIPILTHIVSDKVKCSLIYF